MVTHLSYRQEAVPGVRIGYWVEIQYLLTIIQ